MKDYHADPLVLGGVQTYALFDSASVDGSEKKGMFRIAREHGSEWNKKGYGIFQTVNSFYVHRRKTNVARINAWFIEVDSEDKKVTLQKITSGPLVPTMVVESKRGYHVYWACLDSSFELAIKTWDRIVKRGLVAHYSGDKKASDICRVLRVPNFYHMKDPNDPYLVKKLWDKRVGYTCKEMILAYPDSEHSKQIKKEFKKINKLVTQGNSFLERVYALPCDLALERLSGDQSVRGELYSFKNNADGTKQIVVDGKNTSCWIDLDNKIGSYENAGPSIVQWLYWYLNDYAKVLETIERIFPECKTQTQTQTQTQLKLI